jgi:hypothetical protein
MHFPGDYLGQLLIKLYECFGISSLLAYSFHFKHKIDVHVFLKFQPDSTVLLGDMFNIVKLDS